MQTLKEIKKEFLKKNEFNSGALDDDTIVGLSIDYDPRTKIGMKCDVIFEGEHYDDEIKCEPITGTFETTEECWAYFEDNIKNWLECLK